MHIRAYTHTYTHTHTHTHTHTPVLLLQYCGITKLFWYKLITLKDHTCNNLNLRSLLKGKCYRQKSIIKVLCLWLQQYLHWFITYVPKNLIISLPHGITVLEKNRQYQKTLLRYNYTTGMLHSTTLVYVA